MLDVVAYTQVIRAMAVSKRIADAEYVIQVMENEGFEPNVITCTTLIRGYTKMSDMEGAESVVDQMVGRGVARNDLPTTHCNKGTSGWKTLMLLTACWLGWRRTVSPRIP